MADRYKAATREPPVSSGLFDKNGRELAAGDLVRVPALSGTVSGRVNHVFELTVFVEGRPYLAHDITGRVDTVELVGAGAGVDSPDSSVDSGEDGTGDRGGHTSAASPEPEASHA